MSYVIHTPPSLPFSIPHGYSPEERSINTFMRLTGGMLVHLVVSRSLQGIQEGSAHLFLGKRSLIQLYRKAVRLGGSPVKELLGFFSIMG